MTTPLVLFSTITATAVTGFLGFLIFFHDKKSVTNKIFITHSFVAVIWAIVNYFSLITLNDAALIFIRLVIFMAVPYVFIFFIFVLNFPNSQLVINRKSLGIIVAIMIIMMGLSLSPLIFKSITPTPGAPTAVSPNPGPLLPIFGFLLVSFFLIASGLVGWKYLKSENLIRRQWSTIGVGLVATFTLLITLVFIRTAFLHDTTFVPYSPIFILPIFIGTAYAILRHHLFSVKVIATELLTFALLAASFIEILLAETILVRTIAICVTLFLLYFGMLLIRSVLREVEQREELERLNKQIADKNLQLEDLSRAKTQLLSLASHQVKGPLAAIKGFASLILEGLYGSASDTVKETVGKIKKSSDELIELVNTLLDLRRIEEGKMEYQFSKVKFGDLVKDMTTILEPLAKQRNLEFTVDIKSDAMVNADGPKLKQVIQNLTENAIKYTLSGFVRVKVGDEGKFVLFSVTDSGLGINKQLIPHLFEEFVRDDKLKVKILGTGLGLFIARKILEAHGGVITAESEGEGKGSRFSFKIPIVK